MNIGFSTGTIALGDYKKGIALLKKYEIDCIELSALREAEFITFIAHFEELDLSDFEYISFHAPSKLSSLSEKELIEGLNLIAKKLWPIVVHPDIIQDFKLWQSLGDKLCIENMDKRKPIGRTAKDLDSLFAKLPKAKFCFDIAHARQVDPTMIEAKRMIHQFERRIQQIHLSHVNSNNGHEPLNIESIVSYKSIWHAMPNVPIILESPVKEEFFLREIALTEFISGKCDINSPSNESPRLNVEVLECV